MFKKYIPHLIAVVGFVVVSFMYASPLLQGKRLAMHDTQMAASSAKELNDFVKTEEFKAKYPLTEFKIVKETY